MKFAGDIFNDPRVAPYIKKGNRLFGSAIVTCPTCERGHTVVVYIELGKRGWYHEMADNRDGTLTIPNNSPKRWWFNILRNSRQKYRRMIALR